MVMAYRDAYYIYYTGVPDEKGAIYCRMSTDLVSWGDSAVVSSGGSGGAGPASAECAFVYYLPHDYAFYLFRAHPIKDSQEYRTVIIHSLSINISIIPTGPSMPAAATAVLTAVR